MDVILRAYAGSDLTAVVGIHEASQIELNAAVPAGYFDDLHNVETVFQGGAFLVADNDGEVVGYGGLMPSGEIVRMRVSVEFQGQGIGRRILNGLIARAAELGFPKVFLHTLEEQTIAQGLYEAAGFVEIFRGDVDGNRVVGYERPV